MREPQPACAAAASGQASGATQSTYRLFPLKAPLPSCQNKPILSPLKHSLKPPSRPLPRHLVSLHITRNLVNTTSTDKGMHACMPLHSMLLPSLPIKRRCSQQEARRPPRPGRQEQGRRDTSAESLRVGRRLQRCAPVHSEGRPRTFALASVVQQRLRRQGAEPCPERGYRCMHVHLSACSNPG